MEFSKYQHVNGSVLALQLSAESQYTIAEKLTDILLSGQLSQFLFSIPIGSADAKLEWKYPDTGKIQVLNAGMYLVISDNGRAAPVSKEDFENIYTNTGVDPIVRPEDTKTVSQAISDFVNTFFPGIDMTVEKLTPEAMQQLVAGLGGWYDKKLDIFDVKFCDCGLTDPVGIGDFLKACPATSFTNDKTTYKLNFNNGAYNEGDPNTKPNYFNIIALNKLLGELRKLDTAVLKKITGMSFESVKEGSPSAIMPSVTEAAWLNFQQSVYQLTGISASGQITR